MSQKNELTIRQFERNEVEFPIEFVIADDHQSQVRFNATAETVALHVIAGHSADVSHGGAGLICRQFVPRMTNGTLRVFDPHSVGTQEDGSPIHDVAFEHAVKVRRAYMISHDPVYFIGVSFVDPEPGLEQRISELISRLLGPTHGDAGEGAGHA